MARALRTGTVTAFDEERGLGEVTDDEGSVHPFHCVDIADGTRAIELGTPVRYVVAGKLGRYEAAAITRR